MADHFERVKSDILRRTAKNGGPTTLDLLDALEATNEDADITAAALAKTHAETAARLETKVEQTAAALHKEVVNAAKERVIEIAGVAGKLKTELDHYRDTQSDRCAKEHKKLFEEEIARCSRPRAPRRSTDETDVEFGGTDARSFAQILTAWSLGKKALAIAATAVIIGLVGLGITYFGSRLAADKAESNGIQIEQTMTPRPVVTVTATPSP